MVREKLGAYPNSRPPGTNCFHGLDEYRRPGEVKLQQETPLVLMNKRNACVVIESEICACVHLQALQGDGRPPHWREINSNDQNDAHVFSKNKKTYQH